MRGTEEEAEFAFVQYRECSPPIDNVDKVMRCLNLQWSIEDDTNNTTVERSCICGEDFLRAWALLGIDPFCSTKGGSLGRGRKIDRSMRDRRQQLSNF